MLKLHGGNTDATSAKFSLTTGMGFDASNQRTLTLRSNIGLSEREELALKKMKTSSAHTVHTLLTDH